MTGAWSLARTITEGVVEEFFKSNVLLNARARRHVARGFRGPLSVKGVVRGEARWSIAGQPFIVDANSCVVLARDEAYDIDVEADLPVETFVVFFADSLAAGVSDSSARSIESLLVDPAHPERSPFPLSGRLWTHENAVHRNLRGLRTSARSTIEQGEVDQQLRALLESLTSTANEVRLEMQRIDAVKANTRAELHGRVLKGKAHLDETIDAPFDLGATARVAGMAPHHFHRTFRAVLGQTPFAYVGRRRMTTACRLLDERDWDVVEVCAAVGYESLPSFTRSFKHVIGRTPAAYRARNRKEGYTICVEGELTMRHFDLPSDQKPFTEIGAPVEVHETAVVRLTKNTFTAFTPTRSNLHQLEAGPKGARCIDLVVQWEGEGQFSYLRFGEKDASRRPAPGQSLRGRWVGMNIKDAYA